MTAPVSVVIPNYNGRDLLAANLPSVVRAAREYDGRVEIIVVDDASSDDSVSFLRATFPQVRVIALPQNKGFAHACNTGVRESSHDTAILLNSDMEIEPDIFPPLVEDLADPRVFAVVMQQKIVDGNRVVYNGPVAGEVRYGLIRQFCQMRPERDSGRSPLPTFYACGGGSAFRRQAFLEFGGFDELYWPFYWEDVDLSLRAWRRGWKVLFEPRSVLTHHISSTIAKSFAPFKVRVWEQKNYWVLHWKNLLSTGMLLNHLAFLAPRLAIEIGRGNIASVIGLFLALRAVPIVVARRKVEKAAASRREKEVFAQIGRASIAWCA